MGASRAPLAGQALGPTTGGAIVLDQSLRFLGHAGRVLVIGAHPDDEDTELLTVLTRGMGIEAAYLSLTRGEGGQNLIGPELGEGLGLLRTGELLAARDLDGAGQYFTRAFDFGFSKTLEDTWAHWPRDSVLKDVVRVVRRFRPDIIVTIFSGTPQDGHGQHQAAGWAAREAFRLAGDGAVFPELARQEDLAPWRPAKLYQSARFDPEGPTLVLSGGAIDPAVGQSFHQIAMRSRSLHRSQDMGVLQTIGPSAVRLRLLSPGGGNDREGGLFAGVDTTLDEFPDAERALLAAGRSGREADLVRARALMLAAWPRGADGGRLIRPVLEDQLARIDAALVVTRRLLCDALSDDARLVAGEPVRIVLSCWNASEDTLRVDMTAAVAGARVAVGRRVLPPGMLVAETLSVVVPDTASLTRPYFLAAPRTGPGGAMYTWPAWARAIYGTPLSPPVAQAGFSVPGGPDITREIVRRTADQALGEVRMPVVLVPRVAVALDPPLEMWPVQRAGTARSFTVTLTHGSRTGTLGRVWLEVPAGWAAGRPEAFRLEAEGEEVSFQFTVRPPAALAAGRYPLHAVVQDASGRRSTTGTVTVEYPHVRPMSRVVDGESIVQAADLSLPDVRRIGYVRGAADKVPEVLRGLGMPVDLLDAEVLERGDLSRYDVIVVGPRAYETAPALVAHSNRLIDYARGGGRVVVQYQQYDYFRRGFAPHPLTVAPRHDRVTDEDAAVILLHPEHRMFSTPNRIGPTDWEGWVQERGLYFANRWDTAWTAMLRMADPGEAPVEGSLLVSSVGKGTYLYTGLAFFRQLPAGVPGAVRLFLNLLAPSPDAPVP